MNIQWGWGVKDFTSNYMGKTEIAPPKGERRPLAKKVRDSTRAPYKGGEEGDLRTGWASTPGGKPGSLRPILSLYLQ